MLRLVLRATVLVVVYLVLAPFALAMFCWDIVKDKGLRR